MRRKTPIYKILGVRTEDDITTIRMVWRRKVKELHPDLAKDKKTASEQLAELNAAFDSVQDHRPFADRRKVSRRRWRKGGVWSVAERKRKRACAEAARRREAMCRRAEEERRRADAQMRRRRAAAARKAKATPKAETSKAKVKPKVPVAIALPADWLLREEAARGYKRARNIFAAA